MTKKHWNWQSFFVGLGLGVALTLLFLGTNRAGAQSEPTPKDPPPLWLSGAQTDWVLAAGEYPDFSGVTFPEGTLVEMEVWDETYTTDPNGASVSMQREGLGGTLRLILPMVAVPVTPPQAWLDGSSEEPWVLGEGEVPNFSSAKMHSDARITAIIWGEEFPNLKPSAITYQLKRDPRGASLYLYNNVEVTPPSDWGTSDASREFVVGRVQVVPPISEWGSNLEEWVFDVSVNGVAFENLSAEQAYKLLQDNNGGSLWKWLKTDKVRFCAFIPIVEKSE